MTATTWWTQPPGQSEPYAEPPAPAPTPPPGRTPPPQPTPAVAALPTRRTLVLLLVGALGFDALVHGGYATVGAALFVAALAVMLLASGRARNPQAVGLAVLAVVFASFVALRTSAWLVPLDTSVALALLFLAASYARGGSILHMTSSVVARRALRVLVTLLLAPAYLFVAVAAALPASTTRRRDQVLAVARGLGLAVPVLVVLGVLLASADSVFGSLFHIPLDAGAVVQHLLSIGVGVVVAAWVLADASNPVLREEVADPMRHRRLGTTEASIVLGGLVALYGTFAAVQVMVAARGEQYVQRTAGVTYAEHARQGFFQLLAVATLTLVVLVGLRAVTDRSTARERRRFVALAELAVLLTLVIVAVAIVRLGLYEQALGLTMLRYACTWIAWWLGAVFVITGVALTGVGDRRHWLTFAIAASFLVVLLAFNAVDPEAVVVQHNIAREVAVGRLDTQYLAELSDDAVPALATSLPVLPAAEQADVRSFICGTGRSWTTDRTRPRSRAPVERGVFERNVAAVRADAIRAQLCPQP